MRLPPQLLTVGMFALVTGLAAGATIASRDRWLPLVTAKPPAAEPKTGHDDHAGHDHGAEGEHSDQNSVPLSEQARANLGLKLGPVEFSDYTKNLVIPGVVVEQPGHSERRITTSL